MTQKIETLKKIAAEAGIAANKAAAAEGKAATALGRARDRYLTLARKYSAAIDAVTAAELQEERPLGPSDGEAREFGRTY